MKISEILCEMAVSRRKAIMTVEHLEWEMNLHLVKILTMPDLRDHEHWKRELRSWLATIAAIRLKTTGNPPIGVALAYRLLFLDRFDGDGRGVVGVILKHLSSSYPVPEVDPDRLLAQIEEFWKTAARQIGSGEAADDVVESL